MWFFCILWSLSLGLTSHLQTLEIPITLEIARTKEQRTWGLMQRLSIPDNHGMLFYFPNGRLWMFNTFIDLSVAFLDGRGTILSISELKAFPEMMDPKRPVHSIKDLFKYPSNDSITQFFLDKSLNIPKNVKFILEMNALWFTKNHVKPGDRLFWCLDSSEGFIHTSP